MAKRKLKKVHRGDYQEKNKQNLPPSAKGVKNLKKSVLEYAVCTNSFKKKVRIDKAKKYLSDEQEKQLAVNTKFYSDYTNDQLKELLAKNRQPKTGSRSELLNRCAEGKLLGGLRKCPKCKGGHLMFDFMSTEYSCKGYSGDNGYVNCNYKSSTAERYPWQEM